MNTLFLDLSLICMRKRVWTLSGPRFGRHLGSQNRSQINLGAVWMGIGYRTSILGAWTTPGGEWVPPRTPTPLLGYIYTRISRALRARSILLDLDLEATSVAGRNWVCTSNLDPSSRGSGRRIGAHNSG